MTQEELAEAAGDVEMSETQENTQEGDDADNNDGTVAEAESEEIMPRLIFASYLQSPLVTLIIGTGEQAVMTAHQGLLVQSPYFREACAAFVDDGSVSISPLHTIGIPR